MATKAQMLATVKQWENVIIRQGGSLTALEVKSKKDHLKDIEYLFDPEVDVESAKYKEVLDRATVTTGDMSAQDLVAKQELMNKKFLENQLKHTRSEASYKQMTGLLKTAIQLNSGKLDRDKLGYKVTKTVLSCYDSKKLVKIKTG